MMNNEGKTPRKEIIKNITIVFLAVLLVLTFFSNTFMNYSLPQVSAVYANSGTISEQIRGSGTVEPAESYEVKFEQTRTVKSVAVKTGQEIKAGDILFELEDVESDELAEAEAALENLELDYKKAQISLSSGSGYESEYLAISRAEDELARLKEQLALAEKGSDPLSAANARYKEAKNRADSFSREEKELTAALSSVDTDDMLDLGSEYYEKMRAAKDAVTDAEKKVEKAQKAYDDLAKEIGTDTDYDERIISKQNELEDARSLLNQYYVQLYGAQPDDDTSAIESNIASQNVTVKRLERELSKLLTDAATGSVSKTKLKNAETALTKAQDALTTAKDALAETTRSVKLDIKSKLVRATSSLADANEKMAQAEADKAAAEAEGHLSVSQLKAKITEKEDEISKLRSELQVKQAGDSKNNETALLDLEAKEKAVEKQREKVNKLKSETFDAVVKAKMGGVVESISVTAGSKAEAGTVGAVINVSDKGFTVEFAVKTEQAKKVKVGDKAEITSWYWGGDFSAVLQEIRPDTSNPQSQKILVFNVSGSDISTGQTITLSMGSKGQPYGTVIPNSAVREDSNGKFVLVMESKSSPLGNRYKAVRYDIDVIVKDDNNSAVNGLSGSEFVITTSNIPIDAGKQIRPAD